MSAVKLRPYQEAALEGARVALRGGARSALLQLPTGCHARGQGILMHDGSVRKVEDIVVGNALMGPDLQPRWVLSLARGRQEMARIVPEDGAPWEVNLDHVLTLATCAIGQHHKNFGGGDYFIPPGDWQRDEERLWRDITVRGYLEILRMRPMQEMIAKGHQVACLIRIENGQRRLVRFTVETLPEADYYGFELDGDRRYLLADGTVTHNTGKSILFQRIVAGVTAKNKRALLLVQGQNLVRQAAKHLGQLGVSVGVEMGDDKVGPRIGARGLIDDAPQIIVASRDSLARRLKHYPPDFFRMIVADEAHHALSAQWLQILAHFGVSVPTLEKGKIVPDRKSAWGGNTILIGLTATPDRGDHGDIMTVFETRGFKYGILEAIDDGWLVPIKQAMCHLDGLDLSKVRTSVGDLNANDLEAVIRPLLEPICREIVKVADGRPTLIYNPLVTMAAATTEHLTSKTKGAGRVVTVTAETEEREAMFKAMARGEIWAFSSVGTLTEGVDIPCATIGAMLRMTKSRPLYAQIMGRLLRPAESLAHALNDMTREQRRAAIAASEKPEAWMLDFAGNAGRHKLIGVADVIGEDEDDKTMSLARGHILRGVTDPTEAIAKAREDLAVMLAKAAGSEIERVLVDPFALFSVKAKADAQSRPPTEAQVEALLNAGAVECKINSASSRDKARKVIAQRFDLLTAQAMLDESRRRVTARQASLRQVRRLVKANLPLERARTISFQDARTAIDELEAQGWETSPAWIAKHSGAAAGATT